MDTLTDSQDRTAFLETPPLPVSWYVDPEIHRIESDLFFAREPRYVGHLFQVPQRGDFATLAWTGHAEALIHGDAGVRLVSNICRHRQSLLLEGRGSTQRITCPVHGWTWRLDGSFKGAPYFDLDPPGPCLQSRDLRSWHGLLFDPGQDADFETTLAEFDAYCPLDLDGWVYGGQSSWECDYNWKTFQDVYFDDYHIPFIHPGMRHYADVQGLSWKFGRNGSAQFVPLRRPNQPRDSAWDRWADLYAKSGGDLESARIVWAAIYPGLCLEMFPDALVISFVVPRGPESCTNVVEYYFRSLETPDDRARADAIKEAYHETAREDDQASRMLQAGRRALAGRGENDAGPFQTPMETGMPHFHAYVREKLASVGIDG